MRVKFYKSVWGNGSYVLKKRSLSFDSILEVLSKNNIGTDFKVLCCIDIILIKIEELWKVIIFVLIFQLVNQPISQRSAGNLSNIINIFIDNSLYKLLSWLSKVLTQFWRYLIYYLEWLWYLSYYKWSRLKKLLDYCLTHF